MDPHCRCVSLDGRLLLRSKSMTVLIMKEEVCSTAGVSVLGRIYSLRIHSTMLACSVSLCFL